MRHDEKFGRALGARVGGKSAERCGAKAVVFGGDESPRFHQWDSTTTVNRMMRAGGTFNGGGCRSEDLRYASKAKSLGSRWSLGIDDPYRIVNLAAA